MILLWILRIYNIKTFICSKKYYFSSSVTPILGDAVCTSLLCIQFLSKFSIRSFDMRYRYTFWSIVSGNVEKNNMYGVFHALHSTLHLQYTDSTHGPNSFLTIKHINSSKISQTNRFNICKWALSNEHYTTTIWYTDTASKNHPRIRFKFLTELWNLKSNILRELK